MAEQNQDSVELSDDLHRSAVEMRRGQVAMFDALGWKGIWKRHQTEDVLEAIRMVRSTLESAFGGADPLRRPAAAADVHGVLGMARTMIDQLQEAGVEFDRAEVVAEFETRARRAAELATSEPLLRADTRFLSDTLVLATDIPRVWGDEAPARMAPIQRLMIAQAVAKMLQACAVSRVPLIFRGAIAEGAFLFDGNQILGEAIDGAAQRMNIADAAVVWFGCSVAVDPNLPHIPYWTEYDMPLRDGRTLHVQAVNPFFGCHPDQLDAVQAGMLRAFGGGDDVDVTIKRQNTATFLVPAARSSIRV